MAEVGEGLAEGAEVKGSTVQGTSEVEKTRCGQSRETPGRGGEGRQHQKCRASRPRQEHAEGDGGPQVSPNKAGQPASRMENSASRMERGCTDQKEAHVAAHVERRGRGEGISHADGEKSVEGSQPDSGWWSGPSHPRHLP